MSLFKKLLMLLMSVYFLSFAVDPPDWDAELVFDDFDDKYGDNINRTYTGAIACYAQKKNYTSSVGGGWWYVIMGGDAEVTNPSGDKLTSQNIQTAFDEIEKCMHAKFKISSNEDYCGIGAHFMEERDYVDLSNMTSLSIKAKGEGIIRVYFESKYISKNYSWGHIGYIIELTSSWKTYDIKVKDLEPAPWSDPLKDGVTWDDCKKEINTIMFESSAPADGGDKEDAEFWIDDIVLKGMKYSDIITPISVKYIKPVENRKNSFSVKNRNVTYTISKAEPVSFSIFNLKGCEIAKMNGKVEAGTHNFTISPAVSQGKYLIKMNNSQVNSFTITK